MKKLEVFAPAIICVIWAFICFGGCINHNTPPVTQEAKREVRDTVAGFCTTIDPPKSTKRAGVINGKQWPNGSIIRVQFIGGNADQISRMKAAYAEWAKWVNLKFEYPTTGPYQHRWTFSPGSAYSYIGTDCNYISQSSNTGNIGFNNPGNSTQLHEIAHALSYVHEQSQPNANICWNKSVVYADLLRTNGWSAATVDANVFAKFTTPQVTATSYDPTSIMQYSVPGAWVCSGTGISGGIVLSDLDKSLGQLIYPGITTTDPPITGTFTLTLQQRQSLLTRVQGFQNAAQISLAAATAAKVAADSSVAFTKRTLGL